MAIKKVENVHSCDQKSGVSESDFGLEDFVFADTPESVAASSRCRVSALLLCLRRVLSWGEVTRAHSCRLPVSLPAVAAPTQYTEVAEGERLPSLHERHHVIDRQEPALVRWFFEAWTEVSVFLSPTLEHDLPECLPLRC
jgi:hypothetical protein